MGGKLFTINRERRKRKTSPTSRGGDKKKKKKNQKVQGHRNGSRGGAVQKTARELSIRKRNFRDRGPTLCKKKGAAERISPENGKKSKILREGLNPKDFKGGPLWGGIRVQGIREKKNLSTGGIQ